MYWSEDSAPKNCTISVVSICNTKDEKLTFVGEELHLPKVSQSPPKAIEVFAEEGCGCDVETHSIRIDSKLIEMAIWVT